jgi:hypothetical protein
MEKPIEPQKSFWKKHLPNPFGILLLLFIATFVVVFTIGLISGIAPSDSTFLTASAIVSGVIAIILALIISLIGWLRRPGSRGKALFGLACIVTLIALFYAEEDVRGKWAWNRFKHEQEAKGEKLDRASLVPPKVPDEQNFALTPVVASTYGSMLDKNGHEILPHNTNVVDRLQLKINHDDNWSDMPTNGNWAKGRLTDLQAWQTYFRTPQTNRAGAVTNDFPTAPEPQTPAQDVLLALRKYDSVLAELRQASQLPDSRFPLEYDKDDPAAILLPHLARLKQCSLFLQLRAIAELQAGQADAAAADIRLALYLIDSVHTEPFFISHLVRIAMLNISLQPVYEGLAEHKWSDAQLAALDSELARFNFLADYQYSIRGEAAGTAAMIDYLRRTRKISGYLDLFENTGQNHEWDYFAYVCPSGWFRQNQLRLAEFYIQKLLPTVNPEQRTFSPTGAEKAETSLATAMAHPTPYNFLERILYRPVKDWFANSDRKFAYAQESADLARVAIALERYRLAHGGYPESLDALAPQFMKNIPNDIIGGQPLKYHKTNDTFVLYSIGWNEKDDGGIVAFANGSTPSVDVNNGDWVWTYPIK